METTLHNKLHPARFTDMSPKMAAIVGVILGQDFTTPALAAITTTSDGFLLGMNRGDCGFNVFIGSYSDLERNWSNLLDCAELTDDERIEAQGLYHMAFAAGARA